MSAPRRRQGRGGRRNGRERPEDDSAVPGWVDANGERMFVVDVTPAGFPIGVREDELPASPF